MSFTKPTVLIYVGAYHRWSALQPFPQQLEQAGYAVAGEDLPTVGSTRPLSDDVEVMQARLKQLIEIEGRDVVVAVHSYAGVPGGIAVKGWSKADRIARGEQGGVIGLIWIAAFLSIMGHSLVSFLDYEPNPWATALMDEGVAKVTGDPVQTFYADVDPAKTSALVEKLQSHSLAAFVEQVTTVGYSDKGYDGRRAYIYTLRDHAVLPEKQDKTVQDSGVEWNVKKLDSDHSPFVSHPQELVKIFEEVIGAFQAKISAI